MAMVLGTKNAAVATDRVNQFRSDSVAAKIAWSQLTPNVGAVEVVEAVREHAVGAAEMVQYLFPALHATVATMQLLTLVDPVERGSGRAHQDWLSTSRLPIFFDSIHISKN
jgi:hypothetical protein